MCEALCMYVVVYMHVWLSGESTEELVLPIYLYLCSGDHTQTAGFWEVCDGFLQWVGCVHRERLSLSLGETEMKYYWLLTKLSLTATLPEPTSQVPDSRYHHFYKDISTNSTNDLHCLSEQGRSTNIFNFLFFSVYWKPWGEMESNQNCISRQSLDSRTLSVNNRMSSLTIGLNQGSKYHYTQVHAAGSCCTWTYRSHPRCLLKFWTLKVSTDFCGCFADMNNDIGKTQEFDMHFVEIQSNYKS